MADEQGNDTVLGGENAGDADAKGAEAAGAGQDTGGDKGGENKAENVLAGAVPENYEGFTFPE